MTRPTAGDWPAVLRRHGTGYLRRHPVASLSTVGEQFILGFATPLPGRSGDRAVAVDRVRPAGQFHAGTAVMPTVLVALPIGATRG